MGFANFVWLAIAFLALLQHQKGNAGGIVWWYTVVA
jgi:hypothetical protein